MTRNDHLTASFIAVVIALSHAAACAVPKRPKSPTSQILFVCEHGNVKSVMTEENFCAGIVSQISIHPPAIRLRYFSLTQKKHSVS